MEKSSNVRWVTIKGKHLPVSAVQDYKKDLKQSISSASATGSGSGPKKKQLSKKDELKNRKS